MVLVCDSVGFGIYIIGACIMFNLGTLWGWFYLLYCLTCEIRLMMISCVHCYYYGNWCGLGRGKLAALFFKKGDPKKFLEKKLSWKDLIPDMLVSLIPFISGIYLLFQSFSWLMLLVIAAIFILTSAGNAFVRGSIACKYCKQRELGCPAEKLFSKSNK